MGWSRSPTMPSSPNVIDFVDPNPDDPIAQAAAAWVVARDRGLSPAELTELSDWLAADPRQAAAFTRAAADWAGLDRLNALPELVSLADATAADYQARSKRRPTRWLAIGSLAAAVAIAATVLVWREVGRQIQSDRDPAAKSYVVLASTARRLALPDGSVAELNGDSEITTDFIPSERRVRLVRGEAHFIVAKNPQRPFVVSAGTVAVRAVGTAFNVRLAPGVVEVIVTEGKVHVAEARPNAAAPGSLPCGEALIMNERAVVRLNSTGPDSVTIDRPAPADFDEALAWKSTRLVFDHTPLDQVVSAFNRYNAQKLALADPELRTRTLTGIFRTDNLAGFTRLLPASVDVVAETNSDNRILLRPAP